MSFNVTLPLYHNPMNIHQLRRELTLPYDISIFIDDLLKQIAISRELGAGASPPDNNHGPILLASSRRRTVCIAGMPPLII